MERNIRSLARHYANLPELVSQVVPVLDRFPGLLHPERAEFAHDDGRLELLLSLSGVLPVAVRGTVYNCPLAFWLPLDFPRSPPIVLVLPTPTLKVRVGPTVDPAGRVTGGYIDGWHAKAEGATLLNLVEYLIQTFGQDKTSYPLVPVSTKSSQSQPTRPPPPPTSHSQPHPTNTGPPRPPPPGQYDSNRASGEYQRPPPVPGGSHWQQHPTSSSTYGSYSTPPPNHPTGGPPLPPSTNDYHNPSYHSLPPGGQPIPRPSSVSPQPGSSFPPDTPIGYGPRHPPPVPPVQSPAFTGAGYVPSVPPAGYNPNQSPRVQSSLPAHLQPPRPPASPPRGPQPPVAPRSAYSETVVPQHVGGEAYHPSHGRQGSYEQGTSYGSYPGTPVGSAYGAGPPQPPSFRAGPPSVAHSTQPVAPISPTSTGQHGYHAQPPANYGPPQGLRPVPAHAQSAPVRAQKPRVNILDDEDDYSSISPTPVSAYGTPVPNSADSPRATPAAPPPPRPPHPELLALRARLHDKLTATLHNLAAETDAQRAQLDVLEADLLKGEPAILDEMQRLQAVRGVCENVRGRYEAVVREAEGRLREYEQRGEGPEVDEIVCSSTVVYNQLVDLVAEDGALEDTIYQLGRGLNSETADIDLDRFLKRVRGLAREQFLKRALINKIQLGLAARAALRSA